MTTYEELEARCAYLEKVIADAHVELDRAKVHQSMFGYYGPRPEHPFGTPTMYLAERVRILVSSSESWASEALSARGEKCRWQTVNRIGEDALQRISDLIPKTIPLSAFRDAADLVGLSVEDKDKLLGVARAAVVFAREALDRIREEK